MKKVLLFTFLLTLISCGVKKEEKTQLRFFESLRSDFDPYINAKVMPASPDLSADKSIINNDYPIEIALYQDGKWYYDLPNLDDGVGTWKFENGVIKLHASRTLFDINITVEATIQGAKELAIRFSDRFGPKVLNMEKRNIE